MEMRMAILQAKKVQEALRKAKQVGLVEEPVTIAGCSMVFRSLTPEAYEAIAEETKELEDLAYVQAFQIGHLCRAIVEIEGVDLRDVDFVETGEADAAGKPVKIERHAWVRDGYVKTWGREVVM